MLSRKIVNNKYLLNYDKDKKSSYIGAKRLYGRAMSQKLSVDSCKWEKNMLKFNEDFMKNYVEDSDKEYIFEVDVEHLKNLHDLYSDLPFLPERMKINKCSKLVCNFYDKNNYVVHIGLLKHKNNYVVHIGLLKQALDHGVILKKVHKVIQLNQEAWLKEHIDMNT